LSYAFFDRSGKSGGVAIGRCVEQDNVEVFFLLLLTPALVIESENTAAMADDRAVGGCVNPRREFGEFGEDCFDLGGLGGVEAIEIILAILCEGFPVFVEDGIVANVGAKKFIGVEDLGGSIEDTERVGMARSGDEPELKDVSVTKIEGFFVADDLDFEGLVGAKFDFDA
jgi:hypothetical protein